MKKLNILFIFFISCIYSFHGFFPKEFKKIGIETFENESIKYGIEISVTQNFMKGFEEDRRLEVVEPRNANLLIKGKIKEFIKNPHSFDEKGGVSEYKIIISAEIEFINKIKNEEFLPKRNFSGWGIYKVPLEDEEIGIERASQDLAKKVITFLFSSSW
ncbi:MAG: LPS assembly lipoprotein LptE [candidate division WOR-3 bacterium]